MSFVGGTALNLRVLAPEPLGVDTCVGVVYRAFARVDAEKRRSRRGGAGERAAKTAGGEERDVGGSADWVVGVVCRGSGSGWRGRWGRQGTRRMS